MDNPDHSKTPVFYPDISFGSFQLAELYCMMKHTDPTPLLSILQGLGMLDSINENGQTLLHLAAEQGNLALTQLLLSYNANLTITDHNTHTPFYTALIHKQFSLAALLLAQGADIHAPIQDENTPFWVHQTALHAAVKAGDIEIIQFLIDHKANINAPTTIGCTPLHVAADVRNFAASKLLLQSGARADLKDAHGYTALSRNIFALNYSNHEIDSKKSADTIALLIEAGVDYRIADALNMIKISQHHSNLRFIRETLFTWVRVKNYCNLPELQTSDDDVRCFLYAQFKLTAWRNHITIQHTALNLALSRMPIEAEPLKKLFQLEVQFKFIHDLENDLVHYNPRHQLGSDKPIAFSSLIDTHARIQHIQPMYDNLLDRYPSTRQVSLLSERQREEAVLELLVSGNMNEVLSDDNQRLKFFELFRTYPMQSMIQYFLYRLYDILAKYLAKTLPDDLKESWNPSYTHMASAVIGLDKRLKEIWLNNLASDVLQPQREPHTPHHGLKG